MAWYSDEQYMMISDSKEKKSIAASAFKQRTHRGKGGSVKFPSDFLTKKELKAMSGACVSYRLSDPMNWETFKSIPDDLKKAYITGLRDRFDCTDSALCEMFNISQKCLSLHFADLGLSRPPRGNYKWNKEKFLVWSNGGDPDAVQETTETPVEAVEKEIDIPVEGKTMRNPDSPYAHQTVKRAVPANGKMTFDGPIEDIVETLRMLLAGAEVTLDVVWTVIEPDGVMRKEE